MTTTPPSYIQNNSIQLDPMASAHISELIAALEYAKATQQSLTFHDDQNTLLGTFVPAKPSES